MKRSLKLKSKSCLVCNKFFKAIKFIALSICLLTVSCATFKYLFSPSPNNPIGEDLQNSAPFLPAPYDSIASIAAYALLREATPKVHKYLTSKNGESVNGEQKV